MTNTSASIDGVPLISMSYFSRLDNQPGHDPASLTHTTRYETVTYPTDNATDNSQSLFIGSGDSGGNLSIEPQLTAEQLAQIKSLLADRSYVLPVTKEPAVGEVVKATFDSLETPRARRFDFG